MVSDYQRHAERKTEAQKKSLKITSFQEGTLIVKVALQAQIVLSGVQIFLILRYSYCQMLYVK